MSTRDVLRANDARFYALAVGFSAVEWSQPSLCDGWPNHDVLAHLVVGYGAGAGVVAAEMLRHGGSSTARTQRRPGRWPLCERPPICSTTSSG